MGIGNITGTAVQIRDLTQLFGRLLGRQVVDKTGLTGTYNISAALPSLPADNGPSLFAALQEQLGLKLESQKGPIEMFIIDSAAKPSEN